MKISKMKYISAGELLSCDLFGSSEASTSENHPAI